MRRLAALLVVAALALGLIGSGVGASYLDSATAALNINVGTFGCTVSTTDTHALVNGNSVTINLPEIDASTAGNSYVQDVTVTNNGSMPEVVHWTFSTGGTMSASQWSPSGAFGYATGTTVNNMTTDLTLAPGAFHTYGQGANGVGFLWSVLDNTYLGKSAQVTYTANCGDVPPPPASKISFVGAASMAITAPPTTTEVNCTNSSYLWVSTNANQWCGTTQNAFPVASTSAFPSSGSFTVTASGGTATVSYTGKTATSFTGLTNVSGTGYVTPGATVTGGKPTLALPAFTVGDIAIVETEGLNSTAIPAGYTDLGGAPYNSRFSYKTLTSADTFVPSQTTAWTDELVAVYRGVSGIGAHTTNGGFVNNVGGASYPLNCSALTLTTPLGAAWVGCMGYDGYATTNAKSMVFDSNTTNRTSSLSDVHVGLADTNGGVSAWSNVGWTGDNFPLPGSHAITVMSFELLSK